jgi:hypothetical protein
MFAGGCAAHVTFFAEEASKPVIKEQIGQMAQW